MAEGPPTKKTEWSPTVHQKAVLKTIFAEGIHSPNPNERKEIVHQLRKHGPVEDKNIKKWFRNRLNKRTWKEFTKAAIKMQREREEREAAINQFVQPPSFAGTSHTDEIVPTQQKSAIVMPEGHATTDDNEIKTLNLFPQYPTYMGMARANPQPVQEMREILPTQQISASVMPEEHDTTVDDETINAGNLSERPTLVLFQLCPGMPRD